MAAAAGASAADPHQRLKALLEQLDRTPADAAGWRQLSQLLQEQGRLEEALPCLERACELDPAHLGGHSALGHLCRNLSRPEQAIHHHGLALALEPDSLTLALNHAFVLPIVGGSTAEIEHYQQRCLDQLERMEARPAWGWFREHVFTCHPFYLAYNPGNAVEILRRYGALVTRWMAPELTAAPLPQRAPRQRPRLGLLSGFFYEHSHARAFEGLITGLEQASLETVLIHLSSAASDAVSERLGRACSSVVRLPAQSSAAMAALADLQLDALFFTDLGMHPQMTLLATRRHAPLQLTGWGVPQSSGLPCIDHYISSAAVESPDADHHYSEQLVRLEGLPCSYPAHLLAHTELPRAYFLLPEDALLLGCLQPMQKLHPDLDGVLEQIATAVPEVQFVFVCDKTPSLTQQFLDRLAAQAPLARARVLLLARMERHEFISLAGCLDLLLDPPYFGSGVSFFEIAHTGTPLVTLEGEFLRNRLVAAAYRLIKLSDPPVAHDLRQLGNRAAELLLDPERRLRLRRELRAKAMDRLYDRQEGVRGFEAFVREAVARRVLPPSP